MSKALIVDDHPFIRATVKYLLKQEGFDEIYEAGMVPMPCSWRVSGARI